MGDRIDFEKSWHGFIPLVGFDGDTLFDNCSGFSGCQASFGVFGALSGHNAVDSGRRDGQELLFDVFLEDEFFVVGKPEGNEGFEAFGTRQGGCDPDISEDFGDERMVIEFFAAAFFGELSGSGLEIEHSDGILAMIATDPTAVIQHGLFLRLGGPVIKFSECLDILLFSAVTHHFCLLLWVTEIMRQRLVSQIATVTFFMRQSGWGDSAIFTVALIIGDA